MVARLPFVFGHEPAGEVVEAGANVSGFKAGDRVALDPFGHCGQMRTVPRRTLPPVQLADHALGRVRRVHDRADRKCAPGTINHGFRNRRAAGAVRHRAACGRAVMPQGRRQRGGRRAGTDRPQHRALGARAGRHVNRDDGARRSMQSASRWRAGSDSKPYPPAIATGSSRRARCCPPEGADVVFDACGMIDSPRELLRRGGELVEVGWPARDLKSAELRALFFHGVDDDQFEGPHAGDLAPRDRDGLERGGRPAPDGDASLRDRARCRGLRVVARAERRQGADYAAGDC